mmetsp:Transcript_79947/g.133831  ORF Transcript_79947/g.133831 Transcript_79947/m.133831 type:complete len:207 (-) Transcript_79947:815-1435(-)
MTPRFSISDWSAFALISCSSSFRRASSSQPSSSSRSSSSSFSMRTTLDGLSSESSPSPVSSRTSASIFRRKACSFSCAAFSSSVSSASPSFSPVAASMAVPPSVFSSLSDTAFSWSVYSDRRAGSCDSRNSPKFRSKTCVASSTISSFCRSLRVITLLRRSSSWMDRCTRSVRMRSACVFWLSWEFRIWIIRPAKWSHRYVCVIRR